MTSPMYGIASTLAAMLFCQCLLVAPAYGAASSAPSTGGGAPPPVVTAVSTGSSSSGSTGTAGSGSATAAGPTNANVLLKMNHHTTFVLAYASDSLTATYLTYEVAFNLRDLMSI